MNATEGVKVLIYDGEGREVADLELNPRDAGNDPNWKQRYLFVERVGQRLIDHFKAEEVQRGWKPEPQPESSGPRSS